MAITLKELKDRQLIWQAGTQHKTCPPCISSCYEQLDRQLQGGWPSAGVIQLLPEAGGIGELRLLLPALQELNTRDKLQAWVNPPGRLTPHNLTNDMRRQAIILTPGDSQQSLWVSEQILSSGCFSSLVLWHKDLSPSQARRLQLAARDSQTLAFIINPLSTATASLAVSMRLSLRTWQHGLHIEVFKRQGAWPLPAFPLDMSGHWPLLYEKSNAPEALDASATHGAQASNVIAFPGTGH